MGILMLLAVGSDLLQDLLPPGPIWFKIDDYCNSLKFFFTIISFDLSVHGIEKAGRK